MSSASRTSRRSARRAARRDHGNFVGHHWVLPYVFSGPAIVVVSLILAFPVLYALYRSMFQLRIVQADTPFVGLGNYAALLATPGFWSALGRSMVFITGCVVLGMALAIMFALALNRALGVVRFLRGLSILPYIVSSVAAGVMFRMFFNRDFGLPNKLITSLGLDPLEWLATPVLAMFVVVVAQVWTDLPLAILVILGGLQTIDAAQLDAASVDGATGWQRIRHISLPLVAPQIALGAVFLSYGALTAFGVIMTLTGGGPGRATETLPIEMYRTAFDRLDMGQGLALVIIMLLLNGLLSIFYLRSGRFGEE